MKIIRPKTENDVQIYNPNYSPRPRDADFQIPIPDILEEPLMCFRVNEAWVGHIIGALSALDQPDAWSGGVEEIDGARQQVRKLIASIGDCIVINDCGDVADCIESGSGGLTDAITNAQAGVGSIVAQNVAGGTVATGDNCTNDIVFGGVTELVNYLIRKAQDALEIIEVATNFLDLLAEWGSAFPLISTITAPIVGYLAWLQETIAENFEAQVTVEYTDALRCDLYCLWLSKCPDGLTWEDIAEYFGSRLGGWEELPYDIIDMLTFMTLGVWDGDDIADVMLFGMVGMQVIESRAIPFINIPGLYTLDTVFALGANNPDGDWSILCDECGEPAEYTYCWFMDGNEPEWLGVIVGAGRQLPVYDPTNEWFRALSITTNGTGKEGRVILTLPDVYSTIRVEAHVEGKNTRSSSASVITVFTDTSSQQANAGTNTVIGTKSIDIDHTLENTDNVRILWRVTTNTQGESEVSSYARLTAIKLTVTAITNPFPASNCP